MIRLLAKSKMHVKSKLNKLLKDFGQIDMKRQLIADSLNAIPILPKIGIHRKIVND
jgi:hypothetical protein